MRYISICKETKSFSPSDRNTSALTSKLVKNLIENPMATRTAVKKTLITLIVVSTILLTVAVQASEELTIPDTFLLQFPLGFDSESIVTI
jgi:hypothetical protein